jgi:hypothetical protein
MNVDKYFKSKDLEWVEVPFEEGKQYYHEECQVCERVYKGAEVLHNLGIKFTFLADSHHKDLVGILFPVFNESRSEKDKKLISQEGKK